MSKRCATVSKLLPFSCVDGPGNRLAIFLQGCNLRCLNCHNPYTMGICDHCGDCVATCPSGALTQRDGVMHWQSDICQQCDTCLQTCTRHASPMTQSYQVEELLAQVRRYAPFINGITLSGGEATLQLPLLLAFCQQLRAAPEFSGLSCLIDSNGTLSEAGWQRLAPLIDGAMIDLKAWDAQVHRTLTGRDNQRVKQSICWLAQQGKLAEVRLLIITQHSDLSERIAEVAAFLCQHCPGVPVRLNAFHAHGVQGPAAAWPSTRRDEIERVAAALQAAGVQQVLLPAIYL